MTIEFLQIVSFIFHAQAEWLPVTIKSWSPINLIYSVSKYSWSNKGFEYSAEYSFKDDTVCGYREINQHTGIIESPIMIKERSPLNFYYHQDCTWLLNSNVERHLTIEIGSTQSRKYLKFKKKYMFCNNLITLFEFHNIFNILNNKVS